VLIYVVYVLNSYMHLLTSLYGIGLYILKQSTLIILWQWYTVKRVNLVRSFF